MVEMAVASATNLALALGVKSLTLSWTNSVTAGATHTVYRSHGPCRTYVAVATGILSPYIDYNVANGEVYRYYVVAQVGTITSPASLEVIGTFVGSPDPYRDSLTSQDARSDQQGAVAVYGGIVAAGCGEYQRLQKLRGKLFLCGK